MRIRLTRKFAESIDGIDLSKRSVGDVIDLPIREARTLIAEGWATATAGARSARSRHPKPPPTDTAADRPRRSRRRRH
jgi:hypothetical protein